MWAQGAKIADRSEAKVDGTYMQLKVQVNETYKFGERGSVGIPFELEWGNDDSLIEINAETFNTDAKKLLGCEYNDPKLKNILEAIRGGASKLYIYKLNHGDKASSELATAKWSGALGNSIDVTVEQDPDAGSVDHPLKETTAEVSAEENVVTVNVQKAPEGADITAILQKESEEEAEAEKFQISKGNPFTVTFNEDIEPGNYKLLISVDSLLLSTANISIEHQDATEAKFTVAKSGSIVDGKDKESSLSSISVTVQESENKVTVTYSSLSTPSQKPEVKVMAGEMIVASEEDKVKIETDEAQSKVTISFGKNTDDEKEYSLQINVNDSGASKEYGTQKLTLSKQGENKDAYAKATYSDSTNEDYSKPIPNRYFVKTYIENTLVDTQKAKVASELIDNQYVEFNKSATLTETAGSNLTGGSNGSVTGTDWEKARNAFETAPVNVVAVPTLDTTEQKAWVEYNKRLRDKYGLKFQIVLPYVEEADQYNYEGVIVVANQLTDSDLTDDEKSKNIVYWVAGAEAGCAVQNSCVAKEYTGAYEVGANYTFQQQEQCIDNGLLYFHLVDGIPTIGKDINTLIEIEPEYVNEKNLQFSQNQAIRVLDAICLDTAKIFNTYFLGKIPNDETGRSDLKNRIIKNREAYATIRAIDTYDSSNLRIEAGDRITDVKGYDAIRFMNVMEYLFFQIEVLA